MKSEGYLCKVKKYAVIILLVLFLKPILPVIDYAVNYEYISKVLCINKAKPELKCNGKCHLMQELAKASDDDKPISSDKKQSSNSFVDLFVTEADSFNFLFFQKSTTQELNSSYANLYSHLDSYVIFHPPIFIS
ncbi:hypothetical protein SAMN05443667_101461 [Flavobacterium gillisiae]|uniref:Uncharacterized protein n=1 Tax=Flavobacterium gillisiae TaxID=150146 RepID=A0A1H3XE59_9FLAO|nr:hypothetical protein SAMN05443667_101461 [Flavobacterium gillisiae]